MPTCTGFIAGAALTAGAAALGLTVAAPVAIVVGLAFPIAGQTGFNAFGLNDHAKDFVSGLVGR